MFENSRIPFIAIGLVVVGCFWFVTSSVYRYFTYKTPPQIELANFTSGATFCRELNFAVCAHNPYKISEIKVVVDGKDVDLKDARWVGSKNFEVPVVVDVSGFTDGIHQLEVGAVDASHHKNKCSNKFEFYVDNSPLRAAFIDPIFKVAQGHTLHVKIQSNKRLAKVDVEFNSTKYECFPDSKNSTVYECFIPIDCELSPIEYVLSASLEDCVKNTLKLAGQVQILAGDFPRQRGFTVKKEKLDEEKEISASQKVLDEALARWLDQSPKEKMWLGRFELPINSKRMTTPFGEIRMTSELGRYMHKGVDLIDNPKAVVWASQRGKVIIKDRFAISGNTVVLDHGLGVFTLYFHLDSFADVQVGDLVKKGNPIGRLGMTGYANGYHLHWELRVNNIAVDPLEWTQNIY